jgi:hypothetical protein
VLLLLLLLLLHLLHHHAHGNRKHEARFGRHEHTWLELDWSKHATRLYNGRCTNRDRHLRLVCREFDDNQFQLRMVKWHLFCCVRGEWRRIGGDG